MKMEKVPNFDTTMVDALSAASEGVDLQQMKVEFQEAGFNCAIVPASEDVTQKYASEYDLIAVLENHILDIEEHIEDLEEKKKPIENTLKWEIEEKASNDKSLGLTNEIKRKIAYEQLAARNNELQRLYGELKIFRREVRRAQVNLGNERRAYQRKVWMTSQLLPTGGKWQ